MKNKEEIIKELLKDFNKYINVNLQFSKEKEKVVICFIFSKKYDHIGAFYKIFKMEKIEGYLGCSCECCERTGVNTIDLAGTFSLAKIHDIGTIEEAVYENTKKALEILLEEV